MCFPIPLKKTQLANILTLLERGNKQAFVEGTTILLPKRSWNTFLAIEKHEVNLFWRVQVK